MDPLTVWQSSLVSSWGRVWSAFLSILPTVLGAIVVFAIGLILAYWVKRLVVEFLKVVKFEKLAKTAGLDSYLRKADIKHNFIELIGVFAEWLVILIFFLAVVDILGLSAVSVVLTKVLGFVPNVLAAALIFAAGYIVAKLAEGIVRGALASIDHDIAKPIGKLSRWVITLIAFFAALDQLQIAQTLIATFFQGMTYTVVLVVGLAVGLGSKEVVSRILNDWYDKIHK